MGYYNYQNGLIYRHLNQNNAWDSHLKRCRDLILKALDLNKPERVTVLGSGWLLELPIAEMIERVPSIKLVDIIHPPDVIEQTKRYKNVEIQEVDVSGGLIEEVWKTMARYSFFKKMKTLEDIQIPDFITNDDPGMVISLNILTQLESLIIDFIRKKSDIREEEFERFRSKLQKRHIDFLMKYKSVLISDVSEVITKKAGEVITINTLATSLPDGLIREEWQWDFDQTGADYYNSRSIMNVVGIIR